MAHRSIELQLRVVLVSTRAALRHTSGAPEQREAVIDRGRALLADIAASATGDEDGVAVDEARAELDRLASEA